MGREDSFDLLEEGPRPWPENLAWHMKRATIFASVVVFLSAALGFSFSERLLVHRIEVRASDPGVATEVAASLKAPSRLNTIWSSLEPLAEQVRRCPRVKRVRIERDLPHRLVIHLDVRKPAFGLADRNGFAVLDEEGVVLFRTGRLPPTYPVVVGLRHGECMTGGRLNREFLDVVLQCLEGAKKAGMALGFTLDLSSPFDYRLRTPYGAVLRLGDADNLVRKVVIGAAVEKHLRNLKQQPAYVDVRLPDRDPCWAPKT